MTELGDLQPNTETTYICRSRQHIWQNKQTIRILSGGLQLDNTQQWSSLMYNGLYSNHSFHNPRLRENLKLHCLWKHRNIGFQNYHFNGKI